MSVCCSSLFIPLSVLAAGELGNKLVFVPPCNHCPVSQRALRCPWWASLPCQSHCYSSWSLRSRVFDQRRVGWLELYSNTGYDNSYSNCCLFQGLAAWAMMSIESSSLIYKISLLRAQGCMTTHSVSSLSHSHWRVDREFQSCTSPCDYHLVMVSSSLSACLL
mgnify:CR=1 FL=1